ncbi:LPD7 domain-containing protein [Campylobacter devanensis]|uniref:LPD7 domain-containing protein n=1 Tax=Campylobacter devanensis TaxID=3161138 RepID=UPI0015D7A46B|nr:LPD7 domain-containing protein [Campylobacter sp. P090]
MSKISSINFKKSVDFQVFHNSTVRPNYAIGGELIANRKGYEALKLKEQIIENAKEAYIKNTKQKFQAKSYEWSAVVNIKSDTTMQDLVKLAKHFETKYGFQCYQIAIHRDEGYIENGEKHINHHAHLEFITLDKQTGKNCFKLRDFPKSKMREIQDEVAEILSMERGQDKRISKRERVEPRKYAQMKEAERKEQAKLKAEHKQELENKEAELKFKDTKLEQEKLSKKQLAELIEAERKAMLQENKELKEANQQAIYIADDYKRLRAIKEQQDITIQELNEQIQRIKDEAKERENFKNRLLNELDKVLELDTKNQDDFSAAKMHLEKIQSIQTELNEQQNNAIKPLKIGFKSELFDEMYQDISKEIDISKLYFDKEQKAIINKSDNWKIKDSDTTLSITNFNSESVSIMLKLAQKKGWDLDFIEVSGSREFKAEVAKQIKEIKENEKNTEIQRLKSINRDLEVANNSKVDLNEIKPNELVKHLNDDKLWELCCYFSELSKNNRYASILKHKNEIFGDVIKSTTAKYFPEPKNDEIFQSVMDFARNHSYLADTHPNFFQNIISGVEAGAELMQKQNQIYKSRGR